VYSCSVYVGYDTEVCGTLRPAGHILTAHDYHALYFQFTLRKVSPGAGSSSQSASNFHNLRLCMDLTVTYGNAAPNPTFHFSFMIFIYNILRLKKYSSRVSDTIFTPKRL